MTADLLETPLARYIWKTRYRHDDERDVRDSWDRVATAIAAAETDNRAMWEERFRVLLGDFHFLPGGRILAGAGTGRRVTLFNCFVMGEIEDSLPAIFDSLKEGALTLQQGGGIGCDFSTLRPVDTPARASGMIASGPVSFMHIWDAMCATMQSTGSRRGAMIATLRCDHPDIRRFIDAKRQAGALQYFNLSVQVTGAFLDAVRDNRDWPLVFPAPAGREFSRTSARELWDHLVRTAFETAEPGVLFIDTINRENNLAYRERLSATNPCGEIPLPPYGACDLGSVNLTRFVSKPFTSGAGLDLDGIAVITADAVRLLDNVIDISEFPLSAQADTARSTRRIGLGVTGLADALIMLGVPYGSREGRETAASILRVLRDSAYRASAGLAREKGSFPAYEREAFLESAFIRRLPAGIRDEIRDHGIRNSHLLAIAPTGTISLLAGNVSSGIEPVFADRYRRTVTTSGESEIFDVECFSGRLWREIKGGSSLPETFECASDLTPEDHLLMQAAMQPFVDNAISKTINVSASLKFSEFHNLFLNAHELGLKGLTVYHPGGVRAGILSAAQPEPDTA